MIWFEILSLRALETQLNGDIKNLRENITQQEDRLGQNKSEISKMKQTIEEQLHAFSKQKSLNVDLTESLNSSSMMILSNLFSYVLFFRSKIETVEDGESRLEEFRAGTSEKRAQS